MHITSTVTTAAASKVGQFEYDPDAKAAYLYLRDDPTPCTHLITRELIDNQVYVDYDQFGRVVGVEFLGMDKSPMIEQVL